MKRTWPIIADVQLSSKWYQSVLGCPVTHEPRGGHFLVDALLAESGDPALQSGVQLRFFIDPSTGQPHIYGHSVTEAEAEDVLARPIEDRPGSDAQDRMRLSRTRNGSRVGRRP